MNNQTHIIFTHYGSSDYLSKSIRSAKVTNQSAKITLIGDENNLDYAISNQITHRHFNILIESSLRTEFYRVFKPVKGVFHPLIRNGRNWLMYVFERWFYIYELAQELGLESFWHFDSDTMILKDVTEFNTSFSAYDSTEKCNGMCLNGFIKTKVVEQYLKIINQLFLDEAFLKLQQDEFDTINPEFAFTEMRAWVETKQKLSLNTCHIGKVTDGTTWDDHIWQGEKLGYDMARLKSGQTLKNMYWDNGFYCCNHNLQQSVEFMCLDLSHAPLFVFDWVLNCVEEKKTTKYLAKAPVPIKEIAIGIARNIKRAMTHYLSKLISFTKSLRYAKS